jgi:predicted TIM-barrel fold metal-dependent hydrolase
MPQEFSEDPVEAFKRCVYISPFWEDNFVDIVKLVGADRVVFGSDWPMADPAAEIAAVRALGLTDEEVGAILGNTLAGIIGIAR